MKPTHRSMHGEAIRSEFGLSFTILCRSMHGEAIRSEFGLSFTILFEILNPKQFHDVLAWGCKLYLCETWPFAQNLPILPPFRQKHAHFAKKCPFRILVSKHLRS